MRGKDGCAKKRDGIEPAVDTILTLATTGSKGSATSVHHLRLYPSVLLPSAYGVALALAKRWRALHTVLSRPMPETRDGPKRIVDEVSSWILEGHRSEWIWKSLPGLERHYAPMSDHLFGVLDQWRESFAPIVADFADQFDVWEILASLTYCETHESWMPVGRNGWRHASRERILAEFRGEHDLRVALREAGFGGRVGLKMCIQRYTEFVAQTPWR